jgi:ribonuclease H2 subunit A
MTFEAPEDYLPSFDGEPVQLGIDEAGRGPVVGPMVYGCCFSPISHAAIVSKAGFADSKQLTEPRREALWEELSSESGRENLKIGYIVNILSAESISGQMLRRTPHNLNAISHDAAISMIRKVMAAGAKVEEVYVDTVGDAEKYEKKLKNLFPSIRLIVVCPKADSIYPIVSAASVCAKVMRDRSVANITSIMKENECVKNRIAELELGSGYPSDERTKEWLRRALDKVFLYPSIVRFSWDTVTQLAGNGASVEFDFHTDEDATDESNQRSVVSMFKSISDANRKESRLFSNRNLKIFQLYSIFFCFRGV